MRVRFGWVLAAVASVGACSDRVQHVRKEAPPGATGPSVRLALTAPIPDFLDVPFPSDIYLANGKIVDPIPNMKRVLFRNGDYVTHALAGMNGFSRIAMATFWLDDPEAPKSEDDLPGSAMVDRQSLPGSEEACVADTSSVFLLDLEAAAPADARVLCRSDFHTDQEGSQSRPALAVGPARGILLTEGHRYVAVVTSRVRTVGGKNLMASPDFQAVIDGNRATPGAQLYGAALDKVRSLLGPALAGDGAEIVGLAPFTTKNTTREIYAMREALDREPEPVLRWEPEVVAPMVPARFGKPAGADPLPAGFTATLDAWLGVATAKLEDDETDDPDRDLPVRAHDKISAIGTGVFEAVNFLSTKGGNYDDPDFATFIRDGSGAFVKNPDKPLVKIWVTLSIPATPAPPTGYPVVIFQHGLGGSRHDFFGLANTFAAKGWVGVAIDSVTFGARAASPIFQKDEHTDYERAPGATYVGGDGIADLFNGNRNGAFDMFGGLKNLGAIRDQFRQAALDNSQLVRLLRSPTLDLAPLQVGADAIQLDPDRIAFVGESLGGSQGVTAAAIEPHVKHWMLNVAGGGLLTELAAHSPVIAIQLGLAGGLNFGLTGDKFNSTHPFVSLAQLVAEPGDPLDYAEFLIKKMQTVNGVAMAPRNVYQTEVIFDELVPNEANEALARAAGFGLALPNVGSNAGISDLKNPGGNPHKVPLPDVAPDADGVIANTPFEGITAVVVQTAPSGHGANLVNGTANRTFAVPYAQFETNTPFPLLSKSYRVKTSYRAMQAVMTQFFEDGFAGRVPRISGFVPPVRDTDGDGAMDDVDADPNDPDVR